jgi:hypothetical protein
MKRRSTSMILGALIVIVIGIGVAAIAFVPYERNERPMWHEETTTGSRADIFAEHYWIGHCDVYTFKNNKKGLVIESIDPEINGRVVKQTITITNAPMDDSGKAPVMGEQYSVEAGGGFLPLDNYYDIFFVHYVRDARSLPADVRKSFLGFYGVR